MLGYADILKNSKKLVMKIKKVEDNKKAWNYIFIFNAGIALASGKFVFRV